MTQSMSPKFLLVTDLDNTLIGNDEATVRLNQKLFSIREQFYLIYATGRSWASVQQLGQDFHLLTGERLLEPDYLITGVGSEIYDPTQQDQSWAEHLSQDWQRDAIAELLQSCPALSLQPSSEQNAWKLSYYAQSTNNLALVEDLRHQIRAAGLSAQVVLSSDLDLDILPIKAGKGQAIAYLRQGLKISPTATLVCGDSGNDISMFEQLTLGVIVNNSQPELLDWHLASQHPHHYLAQSTYAWAILEALAHFQLLPSDDLS